MNNKSEIQAVVFFKKDMDGKKVWDVRSAKKWLKDNDITMLKEPDTKLFKNQIRFRVSDPDKYKRFTSKKLPGNRNINIIFGWFDESNTTKQLKKSFKAPKKKKMNLKRKKIIRKSTMSKLG